MLAPTRQQRFVRYILAVGSLLFLIYYYRDHISASKIKSWRPSSIIPIYGLHPAKNEWRDLPVRYPVTSLQPLPTGSPKALPKVQFDFPPEEQIDRKIREERQAAVRGALQRCWDSYREYAWMADELAPQSRGKKNPYGGWAATLVDTLDTLWMADMKDDFGQAVAAAVSIDFSVSSLEDVNVFETTIRYLGGFLAAFDLSGDRRLLSKAIDLGDMLLVAFDTPNRMPITRWKVAEAKQGQAQVAHPTSLLAEVGSLTLEFTRLAMLTGDARYYDAVDRVMKLCFQQQDMTRLPGMWAMTVDTQNANFTKDDVFTLGAMTVDTQNANFTKDDVFTLGAMADSHYEYLPKMTALLGGLEPMYERMYKYSMKTAIKNNIWRPMTPDGANILLSGIAHVDQYGNVELEHQGQHLVCFAGGMFALGAKLFDLPEHLNIGEKLTDGCIWTSKVMPLGIMPEMFFMASCPTDQPCDFDRERWLNEIKMRTNSDDSNVEQTIMEQGLVEGFTEMKDAKYHLRPEVIESIFILYRITGRKDLLDSAWALWTAIDASTKTNLANVALSNVTSKDGAQSKTDTMESFWMAETIKYFYLIFSTPDVISLDEYVFNTEAHPFKRLQPDT